MPSNKENQAYCRKATPAFENCGDQVRVCSPGKYQQSQSLYEHNFMCHTPSPTSWVSSLFPLVTLHHCPLTPPGCRTHWSYDLFPVPPPLSPYCFLPHSQCRFHLQSSTMLCPCPSFTSAGSALENSWLTPPGSPLPTFPHAIEDCQKKMYDHAKLVSS